MPNSNPKINQHESHRVRDYERGRIIILPPPSTERIAWTGSGRPS